jgi:hypothetical protein
MRGEYVVIMKGSEANQIIHAIIAPLGCLVPVKIFSSSSSCILTFLGSIKDGRIPLQVIIKEIDA